MKGLMGTLTARLPKCARICTRDLCVYLGGLYSTINLHWSYTLLTAVQLTFDFDVQLLRSIFQKYQGATASLWSKKNRNWPSNSRFSQVQVNSCNIILLNRAHHSVNEVRRTIEH